MRAWTVGQVPFPAAPLALALHPLSTGKVESELVDVRAELKEASRLFGVW